MPIRRAGLGERPEACSEGRSSEEGGSLPLESKSGGSQRKAPARQPPRRLPGTRSPAPGFRAAAHHLRRLALALAR